MARVALADLELAVRRQDNLPEAHLLIGRLQSLPGGDHKQARGEFDKALAQSENNPAIQAVIFALRGEITEDPEKQLADFNKALELQPELSIALRSRGVYYMNFNHPEKAVEDFRKAARLEPGDPRIHEILALSLLVHGNIEESLESLNRAINLDPDGASALAYRARIYLQQTKLDLALADINRAIELVVDNLSWRLVRGQIYFEQGDINKALAEVERVLAVDAKVLDAVRLRAAILATDDQMKEAIAGLQRAVEAMPENNELLMSLAIFYATDNQNQQALETYKKLLNRPVPHSPVYRSRGDLLLNLGRQAEAVTNYEQALELAPEDAGVLNNLAWVLATSPEAEIRDGDRSLKLAIQACQATEYKKAHILSTLAAAYAENGDFKSAIDWSSQAVARGDEEADDQLEAELKSYQAGKPWREIQSADKEPENSEAGAEEIITEDQVEPSEPPQTGRRSGDTTDAPLEEPVTQ
jgi:tetratricopeptide (TPR) repeat protein